MFRTDLIILVDFGNLRLKKVFRSFTPLYSSESIILETHIQYRNISEVIELLIFVVIIESILIHVIQVVYYLV